MEYVAMVIGCLECSNPSFYLGTFPTESEARAAIDKAGWGEDYAAPADGNHGQYQARIFSADSRGQSTDTRYWPDVSADGRKGDLFG